MIRRDDVRHIARLARVDQGAGEARAAEELGRIVEWVDRLRALPVTVEADDDTGGDAALGPAVLAEAADVPHRCLDRDVVLANAPAVRDGLVVVPGRGGGR